MTGLRIDGREAAAAVADLGVLLPVGAALVVVNGVSAVAAFGLAGVLFVVSGAFYRVPMPVQPIKAAAAIAIATGASPELLAAAGLLLGAVLLAIALTGAVRWLVRVFPKPIIRGNQLGVGILLLVTSFRLVRGGDGGDAAALVVFAVLVGVMEAARGARGPVALAAVAGGIAWSVLTGARVEVGVDLALPGLDLPDASLFGAAFTLLVIPQLPLTLGNAVVGTADLEREYFGARARRATPRNLLLTCGTANVVVGAFGGMPLCHGSSGATAYHRFGARTGGVNLVVGGVFIALAVLLGPTVTQLFGLIPTPVLGAMLATVGIHHAALVRDQRGAALAIALAMGIVGGATQNLAWAMAVGIPAYLLLVGTPRALARR